MALTLDLAERIVKAGISRSQEMGIAVSIAIVDDSGNLAYVARMDGAPFLSPHIAAGKAYTSAAWRASSADLEDRAAKTPYFQGGVSTMTQGRALFRKGALPIVVGGKVIGAAGASGGTSDEDEDIVAAGIESVLKS